MGRLVEPMYRNTLVSGTEEDLAARVAKYVPIEVAGLFPIIDNATYEFSKQNQNNVIQFIENRHVMWAVFIAMFFFNIFYIYRRAILEIPDWKARKIVFTVHCTFSCIAFLLWTYIIKGSIWQNWQNPYLAIIFVGLFVLAAGLVKPIVSPS